MKVLTIKPGTSGRCKNVNEIPVVWGFVVALRNRISVQFLGTTRKHEESKPGAIDGQLEVESAASSFVLAVSVSQQPPRPFAWAYGGVGSLDRSCSVENVRCEHSSPKRAV
eukprot:gene880-biopygen9342